MSGLVGLAALVACASLACAASAQESQSPGDAPQEGPSVVSYPAAFFAEFSSDTAREMISRLPGFTFDGGSQARGFAGTAGNVLIDGERPPSRGDSLSDVLGRIPASQVLRIDIVRGGAGGIDMQGKPVVANVIRRTGAGFSGAAFGAVQVNEHGVIEPSGRLQGQVRWGNRLLEGSIFAFEGPGRSRGERERIALDGTPLRRSTSLGRNRFRRAEITAALESPLAGGDLRVNTLLSADDSQSRNRDRLLITGGEETSSGFGEGQSGELGARYSRKLWWDMDFEGVAFQQLSRSESASTFETASNETRGSVRARRSGESILSGAVQAPKFGKWSVEAGSEVAFNWREVESDLIVDGVLIELPAADLRVEELRNESFLTTTFAATDALSIETGVRYERSTISALGPRTDLEKNLAFTKPRVNIAWAPAQGHQLGLRIERTVSQLSFDDFAASADLDELETRAGNPDLEPEKRWTVEGRWEWRFGRRGSILAQYFHHEIEDILDTVLLVIPATETEPEEVHLIERNAGGATQQALVFTMDLPLDRIGFAGALLSTRATLRESEREDPITGDVRRLSGETPYDWELGITQDLPQYGLRWGIDIEGEPGDVDFEPREIATGSPDLDADMFVDYRPRPDVTLSFQLRNLVNGPSRRRRLVYDGPRNTGVPEFFELRTSRGSTAAYFSVRKSL